MIRNPLHGAWALASITAAIVASSTISTASAQHAGDIGLTIANARITTSIVAEENAKTPQRVFSAVLGEFGLPGVGDEPGFDNLPGTFDPGSSISFTLESALRVWDGADFVTTAADPLDGVRMKLSFADFSATSGAGSVNGFALNVSPIGEWHVHYIYELMPAEGAFDVPPGAYLIELTLHSSQEGVDASKPFWIVFNHELDEAKFDAIVEQADAIFGCPADLTNDDVVDGTDLAIVLGSWGIAGSAAADLNEDGVVDGTDLAIVLGAWGECL